MSHERSRGSAFSGSTFTLLLVLITCWFLFDSVTAFPLGRTPRRLLPSPFRPTTTRSTVRGHELFLWKEAIMSPEAVGGSLMDTEWIATMVTSTDLSVLSSSVTLAASSLVSPEPIHAAFTVATFLPQPFWLLLIFLPDSATTKRIMGGLQVPLMLCFVHLFIVVASLNVEGGGTAPMAEFGDVFDLAGDPQAAFVKMTSSYPNFAAEEWSHVLTWDLFVGRWIWLDALERDINRVALSTSVLLCNLIGPPGLILYAFVCLLSGRAAGLGQGPQEDINSK